MFYELATLSCPLMALDDASRGVRDWLGAPGARGEPLGCWRTDIGDLGRILALRGFKTQEELVVERERALMASAPFGARPATDKLQIESYRRLPFLAPIDTGPRGKVYEVRTYHLKPGGLAPTIAAWKRASGPAHAYTSHLVVNMYALDGAVRITHIWAFENLEERAALRSAAYAAGVWPPPGGPEQIALATSTIAIPEEHSLLH